MNRRFIVPLVASAIALTGCLIPSTPASADPASPSEVTVVFTRGLKNCNVGTVTVVGVAPSTKLYLTFAWVKKGVFYSDQINRAKGGSGSVWRYRFDSTVGHLTVVQPKGFPTRAFRLNVSVWKNLSEGGIGVFEATVPACKRKK